MLIFRLEQNLLAHRPTDVESLPLLCVSLAIQDFDAAKKDNVNKLIVKTVSVQSLSLIQIDYAAVVQDYFHCLKRKLTENGMEVMQAKMRDINLDILILLEHTLFISILYKLFLDFKEALFDLFFYLRL